MANAAQSTWSTKQLVTMALLCAIAILLSFFPEIPIFPPAPFLKYDASFVPVLVTAFAYGPGAGLAVGFVEIGIHGLLMGDLIGSIMNVIAMLGFVLPAALVYRKHRTWKGALVGMVLGCIGGIIAAVLGNLVFTPLYGVPFEEVLGMIVPILVPFNLIKTVLNSVLTALVYKGISNLITPEKDQVVGK